MARERGGIIIVRRGSMLMTLAKERRWRRGDDGADVIPIRWLGGKVNAGEGYEAAALREAQEEIAVEVALRPAPVTYVGRRGSDVVRSERHHGVDGPAPLLVSLRENGVRSVSYAGAVLGEPTVGDVPGLLWVPLEVLPALAVGLPFSRFELAGIELSSAVEIPDGAVARLGATGTEHLTRQVVDRYGIDALDAAVDRSPAPAIQLA